jgi:benzoate/toluate 1,2-dioxygenase beta subunit
MNDKPQVASSGAARAAFPGAATGRSEIDDAAYARIESFLERIRTRADPADLAPQEQYAIEALLRREARLLDLRHFEAWMAMFAQALIYWVPGTPESHALSRTASINFDDRRRLLDRIAFTATGVQCAQIPRSRTCRLVTNVEGWRGTEDDVIEVRSNVTIWEHRHETRCFVGVQSFLLRSQAGGYVLEAKVIDLVNSAEPQGNNSFII